MKRINISKEFLIKEYIINKKSAPQIAKEMGYCGANTIRRRLIENDISIRPLKEAVKLVNQEGNNHPAWKGNKAITRKSRYCIECLKEVTYNSWKYGTCRCQSCSRKNSLKIGISKLKTGKDNKMYIDGRTNKQCFCIVCNKKVSKHSGLYGFGRCATCSKKGILSPFWNNGASFAPYPISWTKTLKESIRERDNHICQICGKTAEKNGKKLDVHHIDYDKGDCKKENLISLCQSCHRKTNHNREAYIEYFKNINKEIVHGNI